MKGVVHFPNMNSKMVKQAIFNYLPWPSFPNESITGEGLKYKQECNDTARRYDRNRIPGAELLTSPRLGREPETAAKWDLIAVAVTLRERYDVEIVESCFRNTCKAVFCLWMYILRMRREEEEIEWEVEALIRLFFYRWKERERR